MTSKRGRSIELFFVDGTPEGIVTATIPFQWSGHVLVTRRTQVKEALDREETLRPGVYLLKGEKDGKPAIYIGETDELRSRTKQHVAEKEWWETAILISSSGEPLNKAHARYLEYRLHAQATAANKAIVENSKSPTESKLSDAARAHMDDFLENIYLVLPALRFDYFTQNSKPAVSQIPVVLGKVVHFTFTVPKNGIKARARLEGSDFVVEANSIARRKWEGALHSTYTALHEELLTQGVLVDNGTHAVFSTDYGFSSASAAAAVVAGRPATGPGSWVVEATGEKLGVWEAKQLNATPVSDHQQ